MKNASRRKRKPKESKENLPVSLVTREGKTTIRQYDGRRFVEFREFRGKRVARVQFFTFGSEYHSISVHFQDRTSFYLTLEPLFTLKPRYYRLKQGELEIIKEWPEIKSER